jgi:murein DD-endopeptidase MepM/ murein hydrolase activator NlpD
VKHSPIIGRDYKARTAESSPNNKRKRHYLYMLAGGLISMGAASLLIISNDAEAIRGDIPVAPIEITNTNTTAEKHISRPLALPQSKQSTTTNIPQAVAIATPPAADKWKAITVKKGDNLSLIFNRAGLTPQQLHQVLSLGKETKALTRIFPGDKLRFNISDDKQLKALSYDIDQTETLHITQRSDNSGYTATTEKHHIDVRTANSSGVINSSLFLGAQKAGLSDNLTMELAGIFGWDIDFALDIRKGDSFTVVYEELYLEGKKLRNGKILAAEFNNNGKSYQAVRYTDSKGDSEYYSPDGKSMRKAFLRTPVEFSRISSRFNLKRKHPVLNKIRAHKGVDYAAPTGTPIRATGDGKIVHRGNKGGYGKTVIIQHGSRYSTLYAHMNNYARGMKNGKRVKQGQIIGYVGSTGLATGPHLHYEFRLNGAVRNPLTVKLPDAGPLPKKYRADFNNKSRPFLAQLNALKRNTLALNN